MSRFLRFVTLVAAAAALAACGTTRGARPETAMHAAAPAPAVKSNPVYKIGQPYQVAGVWYYPREQPGYDETGIASWYGSAFHGQVTADGEVFDRNAISAAHPTLPLPVNVRVTNLENGRSIIVRVNDRGPFVNGRIIDLSEHAADLLGYRLPGTARVRVSLIGRADLYGPGLAPPSQETPVEVATAVPAAPTAKVAATELPPVMGASVAPTRAMASMPAPVPQMVSATPQQIPDGRVTELPVPRATAIFVQAGAFTVPTNAALIAAKLQSLGAHVYPGMKDGQAIYRVRIGPFQAVGDADTALARVQALGHNDVQIVVEAATS